MSNFRPRKPRIHSNNGWRELTRGAPLAVFLAVALLILYNLLPVLELVAVALLLALVLRTTLQWLQKIVRVRWVAVMILVGLLAGFGLFLGLVVIPSFVEGLKIFPSAFQKYQIFLINLSAPLQTRRFFFPALPEALEQ